MTTVTHQPPLPLPLSNSTGGGTYSSRDGYWLPAGYPIIKGVIKIEEQTGTTFVALDESKFKVALLPFQALMLITTAAAAKIQIAQAVGSLERTYVR